MMLCPAESRKARSGLEDFQAAEMAEFAGVEGGHGPAALESGRGDE